MRRKTLILVSTIVLVLTTVSFAPTWTSTSNNRWDVAGNWSGGIPSGTATADSEALYNSSGKVPCLVDSATTAVPGRISLRTGNNVLNITGGSCIAQYNTGRLTVGWEGVGTVNISGGTVTGNYALHMGRASGGNGTINISGTGMVKIFPNPSTGSHEIARIATEAANTTAVINLNGGTFHSEIDVEAGVSGVLLARININAGAFEVATGTTTGNTHAHNITIGRGGGAADVNMTGGLMSVSGNLTVGSAAGSTGVITMNGGEINVVGNITLGASSGVGTVYLNNGNITASNVSAIGAGSKIQFGSTTARLILSGDDRTAVNGYIGGGLITQVVDPSAYFVVDYSGGVTTVYVYNPNAREASAPVPTDGSTISGLAVTLSWTAGSGALSHDVYFGDDYNDVDSGIGDTFKGNQPAGDLDYGPIGLDTLDKSYYWRIDEHHSGGTAKGAVWTFKTPTSNCLETFNGYASDAALKAVWGSNGALETTIVQEGKSMKIVFNSSSIEASKTIVDSNWTIGNAKTLVLWYRGHTNISRLYVKLESNGGAQSGILYDSDAVNENREEVDVKAASWHQMNFTLADFGVQLTNVTKLTVGVIPETGTSGQAYFDLICLYQRRAIGSLIMDFNGDNVVDSADNAIFVESWLKSTIFPPQ